MGGCKVRGPHGARARTRRRALVLVGQDEQPVLPVDRLDARDGAAVAQHLDVPREVDVGVHVHRPARAVAVRRVRAHGVGELGVGLQGIGAQVVLPRRTFSSAHARPLLSHFPLRRTSPLRRHALALEPQPLGVLAGWTIARHGRPSS